MKIFRIQRFLRSLTEFGRTVTDNKTVSDPCRSKSVLYRPYWYCNSSEFANRIESARNSVG